MVGLRLFVGRGAALLAAAAVLGSVLAGPRIYVRDERRTEIEVHVLNAPVLGGKPSPWTWAVPEEGGEVRIPVAWPAPHDRAELVLRAFPRPPRPGAATVLELESELRTDEGGVVRARREMTYTDSGTALFEVQREGERTLTLALVGSTEVETTLSANRRLGLPVRLHLAIEHVAGPRAIPLERNRLDTFVGEPVTYSFRLGETGTAESLELRLLPRRRFGELLQVRVEVTGTMPDGERLSLVSRTEELTTSVGATSSVDVVVGDPPTGYRFRITPEFPSGLR